jgi:4-amino-4-deoxy-L-arabinose transferase-like glycosyltransferase
VLTLGAAGRGAGASHVGEPPGSPGGVPLAHPDATPLEESTIEQAAARSAGAGATLIGLLALAAGLRMWRLDQQGWGNEYYTAAVRSMSASWHNFLFNSFDPAGFVSVDKPPVALWAQVASAGVFGFHGWSVLLPQVLEGVAAVWLVHRLVERRFGEPAGLLAAFFLAIMPISVAVDRSTNTESCLVLVLLLAAWALSVAAEWGSRRLLLLAFALVGLGFNVKMLAAWVVLPTFAVVYVLGAPRRLSRRLVDLALAGLVCLVVSAAWVVTYDLTSPDRRPFVGSSKQNSMVELAIGHNAVGRFVRAPRPDGRPALSTATGRAAMPGGRPSAYATLFVRTPVGPLRLADGPLAAQVAWMFPLAVMGIVTGLFHGYRGRPPLDRAHLALILWSGWLLTYAIVYSSAGGIFHFYYLSTMAAPMAALAGIGVAGVWGFYLQRGRRALLLPAALLGTAAWQLHVELSVLDRTVADWRHGLATVVFSSGGPGDWRAKLHLALMAGTLLAALLLVLVPMRMPLGRTTRRLATAGCAIGVLAVCVLPAAWALSSVLAAGNGVLPSASLSRLAGAEGDGDGLPATRTRGASASQRLVDYLVANRQGERFLLGTSSTRLAAPIIIETGEPVMAMGGFHGLDPILTPERLARMVETKQVRFVMLGDLSPVSRVLGGEAAGRPIADWVRANGRAVDPELWRSATPSRRGAGGLQLYDLRQTRS